MIFLTNVFTPSETIFFAPNVYVLYCLSIKQQNFTKPIKLSAMNYVTEKNERRARSYAVVLAIGLHLSLGAVLYSQMTEPSTTKVEKPVKVDISKDRTAPKA